MKGSTLILKMKASLVFIVLFISSCGITKKSETQETTIIEYTEFNPEAMDNFEFEGFDVDYAYKIDSSYILVAYAEGDLEYSETPVNWGDRLLHVRNEKILFESKPVGDVYLYEPHFYKNTVNHSIIIICQLGYEYYFGGDAFIFKDGIVKSIGSIDMESLDAEIALVDIVAISEVNNEINFKFNSDSLVYSPGGDDIVIKNNNVHYIYTGKSFKLTGM